MNVFKSFMMVAVFGTLIVSDGAFAAAASNATQTVAGGGVTAKVTYLNPESRKEPRFEVVLDTHSVDLDAYDFKNITIIRNDAGETHSPARVEVKGGGHHRTATLIFPNLSPEAKRVELVIKDVAGVKERTFHWDLR
jgi:hypothetical protein